MIKYDYLIQRDEKDEVKNYCPKSIPTELEDIVYIEGPNSSGKSTLLNIIALAFYGLKLSDEELIPELKDKIRYLIDSKHQKIKFKIEVFNKALNTHLLSIKPDLNSKDFSVKVIDGKNKKNIDADQFKKKYKIIYDIPNNPLGRLPQLLTEVKSSQKSIGWELTDLVSQIKNSIDEIQDARDPKRISSLDREITKDSKNVENNEKKLNTLRKSLDEYKKYFYSKFYIDYKKQLENAISEIERITKLVEDVQKGEKKHTSKLAKVNEELKKANGELNECYTETTNALKRLVGRSEKVKFGVWQDADPINEIKLLGEIKSTKVLAGHFDNKLREMLKDLDQEELGEVRLVEGLLNLLNEFRDSNILVPGTNKTIDEFIEMLNQEQTKFKDLIIRNNNIKDGRALIEKYLVLRDEAIKTQKKHKETLEKLGETGDTLEELTYSTSLEDFIQRKEKIEDKVNDFEKELHKIDIDDREAEKLFNKLDNTREYFNYRTYKESDLWDKLIHDEKYILDSEDKQRRLEDLVERNKSELERLKKKEPHKYQRYLGNLQKLLSQTQFVEQKMLAKFDEYVDLIIKNKMTKDCSKEELMYADALSEYLAKKVGNVRHIDMNYNIEKSDIIKKEMLTDSGKNIKFGDLGTGQSQAAYLDSLLNIHGNKKIIALFDEVAMMDSKSMNIILDKLRKLYNENKLLLGIVVQKADEVNVKSII